MSALLNTTVGGASEFRQDLSQGGTDVREEGVFIGQIYIPWVWVLGTWWFIY